MHSVNEQQAISRWETVGVLMIKPIRATVEFLEVQNVSIRTPVSQENKILTPH